MGYFKNPSQVQIMGASPAEVEAVKTGIATEKSRIDEVIKNPEYNTGAVITFIDDDAQTEFTTTWQPVLEATGAKISLAVMSGKVGTAGYMTLQQLKDLHTAGHEMLSHTVNGQETSLITPENAETEYATSKQWLIDNGFSGYDTLVYPGGLHTERLEIKAVARKYYRYAVATQFASLNYLIAPFDNWRIHRANGDTKTLEQLKAIVDQAITASGWVVIMTHSHVLGAAGAQKMQDLIAYIQSKSVPIMTFGDAAKIKGNAIAIGEYTNGKSLFVGVNGGVKSGGSGSWVPTLEGSTVAGQHTYTTRGGSYIRRGDLVTVQYTIRIEAANLDATMAGNLSITGLPFKPSALFMGVPRAFVEYNKLVLGSNYTTVVAGIPPNYAEYIALYRMGNNVPTDYIAATAIPAGQVVTFVGQLTYVAE
jgi:putative intracellular protease/amidase